tara:strand:- start:2490 stop:2891 length:402 start_codon:yes stop_codon:yes gene_type:complete
MTQRQKDFSNIFAPISIGELIDKITILEIKRDNIKGHKLVNVKRELESLKLILEKEKLEFDMDLFNSLKEINNTLWHIEDKIRVKENKQQFDMEFIQLARSVYKKNDERASIKRKINQKYNSEFVEEKSYAQY